MVNLSVKELVLAALFAALTAVGAMFRIPLPFSEVPLTLQVFFVLLAGALLRPAVAGLSQLIYILLGAVGVPVFAGFTSGIGVLSGPTGGYIFGFLVSAIVISLLVRRVQDPGILITVGAMLIGVLIVYGIGVVQLAAVQNISVLQAVLLGAVPFVLIDIAKAGVAATIASRLYKVEMFAAEMGSANAA